MSSPPDPVTDFAEAEAARKQARVELWDGLAAERDRWRRRGRAYHQEIIRLLRFLVPRRSRVLELGTTTGDVLHSLEPEVGVGVDLSPRMIELARAKYPELTFHVGDAEALPDAVRDQRHDFVVLSDLVGHLDDIWKAFREVRGVCHPETRVVLTWYSFLWEPLLKLGEKVGLKMPVHPENWLSFHDLETFLSLNHLEVVSHGSRTLLPLPIPLLAPFCNTLLSPLPVLRWFNLIQYLVARPVARPEPKPLTTSVIVPCRNERGNVEPALRRLPRMGPAMEVLFCDGHSTDGTVEEIQRLRDGGALDFEVRLLHQEGTGKGAAVYQAFDAARHDVLFILDADLTVPPEELPKFYLAIAEGRGELINGTRMVYPMERGAMRLANILGNKFFSLTLSWILGQRIKDTLCGTKVLAREHYRRVRGERDYFGDFDPWGDFQLIFGATKQNLAIRDLPVRYRARVHGDSKMHAFRDGWTLLRMTWVALLKLRMRR